MHKKVDQLVLAGKVTEEHAEKFKEHNGDNATAAIGCECAICKGVWAAISAAE